LTEEQQAKAALDAQKAKEEAAKAEAESQKRWEAALAGLAALEPKANIPIHAPSLQQVQPTVVRGGSSQAPTNIPMPTFTKQNTAPRILKFLR
jgi:outer membrane protein TolC